MRSDKVIGNLLNVVKRKKAKPLKSTTTLFDSMVKPGALYY